MELEEEMAKPRDRKLDRLLELVEQLEVLRVVEAAAQDLQPHARRGDRLDGVVVDRPRDPASLLLARSHEVSQQRTLTLELGLRLQLRHVPRHRRSADDLSVDVADRRDLQHDVQHDLVLPHPLRLVLLDFFAPPEPGQDLGEIVGEVRRCEQRDRAADGLLRGVAVHSLRAEVPGLDRSLDVLADDRVVGGFDDRRELAGGDLNPPALAHIPNERGREAPLVGVDRCQRDVDRELAAVLAAPDRLLVDEDDVARLVNEPALVRLQRGHGDVDGELLAVPAAAERVDHPHRGGSWKVLGQEVLDRLSEHLVAPVPEEALGFGVDELHGAAFVDDDDRIGSRLDEAAEPLLASPHDPFRTLALVPVSDELVEHARDRVDGEARLTPGGALHGFDDLRRRGALDEVAHGSRRQHLDHGRLVVVGREGEHSRFRPQLLHSPGGRGSAAGHPDVDEDDVGLRGRGELDRLLGARGGADDLDPALARDEVAQGQPQRLFVLGDQDPNDRRRGLLGGMNGPNLSVAHRSTPFSAGRSLTLVSGPLPRCEPRGKPDYRTFEPKATGSSRSPPIAGPGDEHRGSTRGLSERVCVSSEQEVCCGLALRHR